MRRELTTNEIQLFARIKKLDFELIAKLKEFLNATKVRNTNIRYEYRVRTKESNLPKQEAVKALMKKHKVSRSYIESIIYEKRESARTKECVMCGRMTSYYLWSKYDGRCKRCAK
ncbi:MAG: hypothetical protein SNH01_01610 [Rikenellaceae bacterium]